MDHPVQVLLSSDIGLKSGAHFAGAYGIILCTVVKKEFLLYTGGKSVFALYGWQKSVYYIQVAKECLLYMGGKRVFTIHGWQKSV